MMIVQRHNLDPLEQSKFDQLADDWWDPDGLARPLHDLNPARLKYVADRCSLPGSTVLDVGCGGGILAESMASCGARVTGIDIAPKVLAVAQSHLSVSGLDVEYREATVEAFADESPAAFDVITCMELLEHVPDPESVVNAAARTVKPGGSVFFSTLNRTPLAFVLGIVGAEHIMRLLPRGTHRYDRFIRPSELASSVRGTGMSVMDICGLKYDPISRVARLGGTVSINYLLHAKSAES